MDTSSQARPLKTVLSEMSRRTGIQVVAITLLDSQLIQGPNMDAIDSTNLEGYLRAIAAKLPIPSRLIKLYLPKGPTWSAEELLNFAKAQSALFRKSLSETKPDTIEILGQSYSKDKAQPAIEALDLKPVYVIALRQGYFGGVWQTTYGEMRLQQTGARVSGTYSTNNGQIEGTVAGNELRFQWYEQSNGSSGTGVVQLAEDAMSFAGPWWNDVDSNNPAGTWTGVRTTRDVKAASGDAMGQVKNPPPIY